MSAFPVKVLNYMFSVNKRRRVVAHCLNFDLVTTADDIKEAERRLDLLVRYHVASYMTTNGASGINQPAPSEYWALYTEAVRQGRVRPASTLHITLPDMSPIKMGNGDMEVIGAQLAAAA
jgi:hypothetical protein